MYSPVSSKVCVILLAIALCISSVSVLADNVLPLVNGSFEEGLKGWTVKTPQGAEPARVTADAASLGEKGLRITSLAATDKFEVVSEPLPVTPGMTYTVSFWSGRGGEKPGSASVKMVFTSSADKGAKILQPAMASIRKWPVAEISGGLFFGNDIMAAAAPPDAATLSIHITPKRGAVAETSVDLDDFIVTELVPQTNPPPARDPALGNPVPPTDPALLEQWLAEIRKDPYRGRKPPRIVIKLDDFKATKGGGVHQRWQKVADLAETKKIKVSFGIIAAGMEADAPPFYNWVKERHAAGRIEFWHHGYDHGRDTKNANIMEFSGHPYEYQKEHMTRANEIAKARLGFAFESFGAPFNATDDGTVRVLQEDPDIKIWMYGKPRTPAGKTVLQRSIVNIETPTLIANYGAFIQGYAHNRGAEYFVLQGHPAAWGEDRYGEFLKIISFLIEQKAEFVFPKDFIANPPAPSPLPSGTVEIMKEASS